MLITRIRQGKEKDLLLESPSMKNILNFQYNTLSSKYGIHAHASIISWRRFSLIRRPIFWCPPLLPPCPNPPQNDETSKCINLTINREILQLTLKNNLYTTVDDEGALIERHSDINLDRIIQPFTTQQGFWPLCQSSVHQTQKEVAFCKV